MNSLIESVSNQASMFKRSLEEALRRSHDASLIVDGVSTLSEQEQVLRRPPVRTITSIQKTTSSTLVLIKELVH